MQLSRIVFASRSWGRVWWIRGLAIGLALSWQGAAIAADMPRAMLMLASDVEAGAARALAPAMLARLERGAGLRLRAMGATRTGAHILALPAGTSGESARRAVAAMAQVRGVLWAELDRPAAGVSSPGAARPGPRAAVADSTAPGITEFLIKLRGDAARSPAGAPTGRLSAAAGVGLRPEWRGASGAWVFGLARALDSGEAADVEQRLEALPAVVYADPVRRRHARSVAPDDPLFSRQWYLRGPDEFPGAAHVQEAWSLTRGAADITVAVLDSGILFRPTHPDLAGRLVYLTARGSRIAGWDMIGRTWQARDGNRRDPNPKDNGDWVDAATLRDHPGACRDSDQSSSIWHGSHMAGIIGAATDNGIGISGIDREAGLLPVRVLGACGGATVDVNDGIYWAAGGRAVRGAPPNPRPARVINLSLGGEGPCSDGEQEAIDYALSRNAVVVVAAGNEGADAAGYSPSGCRGVITVGALDPSGQPASFSNYGAGVSVAAPGGGAVLEAGILSTVNGSPTRPRPDRMEYRYLRGTSMSTAVVTGIVALMLAADTTRGLTPARVRTLLQSTARPFPPGSRCAPGGDRHLLCGAGMVDALEAVRAVLAPP